MKIKKRKKILLKQISENRPWIWIFEQKHEIDLDILYGFKNERYATIQNVPDVCKGIKAAGYAA